MSNQSSKFEPLLVALDGHWHEKRAQLPVGLRERLARDLAGIVYEQWDSLIEDGRRYQAAYWDYRNDPAPEAEEKRTIDWDGVVVGWDYWQKVPLLTAEEFSVLRHVHDPRNFVDEKNNIPGGDGRTLGERVNDDVRIIERTHGLDAKKAMQEWVSWAQKQDWGIPSYLLAAADRDGDADADQPRRTKPVTSKKIIAVFVIPGQASNKKWWDRRMGEVKDYGLTGCRASPGRGKRPSLWYPDQIAGWLIDKKYMSTQQVAKILRKEFPECSETADMLDVQN